MRVELLDVQNRPLAGYSGESCVPIGESGTRLPVRWRGGDEIADVKGRPFKVKVTLAGGLEAEQRVYAIYLAHA